jgi:iron complex transport system permease protein
MDTLSGARPAPYLMANRSLQQRRLIVCTGLLVALIAAIVLSAAHGPANIPYGTVARLLLHGLGFHVDVGVPASELASDLAIVNVIRLPRILVGALVGAALAASGATMQGVFRNALADPGLLGVGAGGGFGAVLAITTGLADSSLWALPAAAFIGAFGASFLVYTLSMVRGRSDTTTLILAGMASSVLLGSLTSMLIIYAKNDYTGRAALGWLFGTLDGRGWDQLAIAIVPITLGMIITFTYSRDLNLLLTGEEAAQALGVDVPRTRFILLTLIAVMTGVAVSIAGGISFVGLMVPHALRLIVGPDYRVLLPTSALGGAVFLVLADTVSRLVIQPAELNVGILTALLGAPFFLFLLWRNRQAISL